jgi:3-oxoacyl-[acyl-carrier protein] reductase
VRAAVVGLAKTMATDLAPHGILVNNVCPGLHRTSRMEQLIGAEAEKSGRPMDEIATEKSTRIPLGRMGEPEELASLVTFLASERAGFITGTTIQVDGGQYGGLM